MKKQPEITSATKNAMLEAFWAVYQQKPIDRITIRDIADTAHIHRSTFYRYFTDIYDVLDQFEQKILDDISATLENLHDAQVLTDLISHAGIIVDALKGHAPAIYHLTSPNGDSGFRDKLRRRMLGHFSQFSSSAERSLETEYLFHFIFTNILANLNFWYEHRHEYPLEQIVQVSKQLVSDGIIQYMKQEQAGLQWQEGGRSDK